MSEREKQQREPKESIYLTHSHESLLRQNSPSYLTNPIFLIPSMRRYLSLCASAARSNVGVEQVEEKVSLSISFFWIITLAHGTNRSEDLLDSAKFNLFCGERDCGRNQFCALVSYQHTKLRQTFRHFDSE